jgi:phosphate/sulfate permease
LQIIGGVIGVATACFGIEAVQWGFSNVKKIDGIDSIPVDGFGPIAVSWVASPIISGVLGLAMFTITKVLVLQDNVLSRRIATNSFWRAVYLAPFFYSFVSAMCVGTTGWLGCKAGFSQFGLLLTAHTIMPP